MSVKCVAAVLSNATTSEPRLLSDTAMRTRGYLVDVAQHSVLIVGCHAAVMAG